MRKQLALPADSELTPESKFSALGADSLDTVCTRLRLLFLFLLSILFDIISLLKTSNSDRGNDNTVACRWR